jgi:aminoglycoside phosphotransferase (APT) family kinase protein
VYLTPFLSYNYSSRITSKHIQERIDMQKGQLIARGRTAEIYACGEHQVLKLFLDWCSAGMVEHELKIARIVQDAGLPVPHVEPESVMIDGRRGIIYERIVGASMLDVIRRQPWRVIYFGRLMAELQAQVHQQSVAGLPTLRDAMQRAIQGADALPELLKQGALQSLAQRSERSALCHGDLHPGNILLTARGPIIIDWMTAMQGDPQADVARTLLLIRLGDPPPGTPGLWLINRLRSALYSAYFGRYMQLCHPDGQEIDAWMTLLAAARLQEGIPAEKSRLVKMVEAGLSAQRISGQRLAAH